MKGPIARGTIRTTFVLGLYLLVQAGTLLLVARMLGPQQFGIFAGMAALAVMLGTLSTFGTNIVLLGEVAKTPSRRWLILPYAIPITVIFGGTLLVIFLAVCMLALRIPSASWLVLLTIGITELCLQPLFSLTVYEHHGLGRIARSQLLKVLPLVLRLVVATGLFLAHPTNPLAAYASAYPLISLVALVLAVRTLPSGWPALKQLRLPRLTELRNAAGYATQAMTASGPEELDKTLATKLLPLATAGVYAAGARIIVAATLPINAMLTSAMPRLFREGQDRAGRSRNLLLWVLGATLAYLLATTLALWLIAPSFEWLFGTKYHHLGQIVRWLCLAVPGLALRMITGTILMTLGRPWVRVGFEIMGLAVLAGTSVALTARIGALGMPLSLAISEWTMAIIGIALVWRFMAPHRAKP